MILSENIEIIPYGNRAVVLQWCDEISIETNRQVHAFYSSLLNGKIDHIATAIVAYSSITLLFDDQPDINGLQKLIDQWQPVQIDRESPLVKLPICYDTSLGNDLAMLAEYYDLSVDKIKEVFSERDYHVFFFGFLPGFPYMGIADNRINTPRLPVPRKITKPGAVGIAGNQVGIYPSESPGGWPIIGYCPYRIFDPTHEKEPLIRAGYRVRFFEADIAQYQEILENE